jgi:hypothetical protein
VLEMPLRSIEIHRLQKPKRPTTEPPPTRESLIQALKDDLVSFEYLSNRHRFTMWEDQCESCITDAIARINDMLNVDSASRGER